jgi:hypothetical protein
LIQMDSGILMEQWMWRDLKTTRENRWVWHRRRRGVSRLQGGGRSRREDGWNEKNSSWKKSETFRLFRAKGDFFIICCVMSVARRSSPFYHDDHHHPCVSCFRCSGPVFIIIYADWMNKHSSLAEIFRWPKIW